MMSGEYEKAIECFNITISMNTSYADAYFGRGFVYGELKQYERAIEDFNTLLELNPDDAMAYYNCGLAYSYLNPPFPHLIANF